LKRADITTRAVAGLIDLLVVIALSRLPDILGFLTVTAYILIRDGLFDQRSIGKKLINLRVVSSEHSDSVHFRESIIRNTPFVVAYFLFFIPYAGWIFGLVVLGIEFLISLGDERGMRIGDMIARTWVVAEVPVTRKSSTVPEKQSSATQPCTLKPYDSQQ